MSKEKNTMAQQTTKPEQAPKGGKTGKPRKTDERPPHVIFAERFNTEARLMTRRYKNLASLGNAKRARPTEAQYDAVAVWLREKTEECIAELGRRLRAQEAQPSDEKPFAVLPEAPAKVSQAPKK